MGLTGAMPTVICFANCQVLCAEAGTWEMSRKTQAAVRHQPHSTTPADDVPVLSNTCTL